MVETFQELTQKEFNELQGHQFVKIDLNLIRSRAKELHKLGKEFFIYNWMVANIAREKWDDAKGYPLKKNFYAKHLLACSFSTRKLAKLLGTSRDTILRSVKKMEEMRWIDTAKIKGSNEYNEQNVYILGEWKLVVVDGDKKYIEELYVNNRWEDE